MLFTSPPSAMHLKALRRDGLDGFCDDMRSSQANQQAERPDRLGRNRRIQQGVPARLEIYSHCLSSPGLRSRRMSAGFPVSGDRSRVSIGYKPPMQKADEATIEEELV